MKKKISLIILSIVVAIILIINCLYIKDDKVEKIVVNTENKIENIILSEETLESANETIEATKKDEQQDTVETVTVKENELEKDAVVEQENIIYNGDIKNDGIKLLGTYQGLTYYSQADKRWANNMYSSKNDKKQTMKSSACRSNNKCNGSNC